MQNMICPKCKKQIPEKSLKCEHCNARIGSICKQCATYNSIYNIKCSKCENELLKVCPSCKSINLPNAIKCRKCSHNFLKEYSDKFLQEKKDNIGINEETGNKDNIEQPKSKEPQPADSSEASLDYSYTQTSVTEPLSQHMAKDILSKALTAQEKKILSLSGARGVGKSIVLKSTINELQANNMTWLFGECSPITQLSPCGLIQDIFLNLFNVANFCSDSLQLKKDSQKFFQSQFPSLNNEEIFNMLNLLYPTSTDYFENMLSNKEKTFSMLKKVFNTIIEKNKTIIVIENFDYIDGMSYEFLHKFINENIQNKNFKIVLTYNEARPARGYLYASSLKDEAYLDISLGSFDKNQTNSFINQHFQNEECPGKLKLDIFEASGGNPAVLEQAVSLVKDFKTRSKSFDIMLPKTFNAIINMRLDFIKYNPNAYKTLFIAALQGIKFSPALINNLLKFTEEEMLNTLDFLVKENYIIPVSEILYEFKNSLLWNSILDNIKTEKDYNYYNESLFSTYSNYTLSSISIMAVLAQNLDENLSALNIWTDNIKLASFIGDTNLYAISQKQCLNLIEKLDSATQTSLIRNNIYERLGKLLSASNPQEASQYLPDAISNARKLENPLKEIELTGYLANCCIKLGNYHGTLECIDAAIDRIDTDFELEIAMLKSRKLDALLNIGNSGEIINLVDTEIMPMFEKYIGSKPHKNISIKSLYKAWLQSYLMLANALVLQGNNRSFEVISTLFDLFEKNNFNDQLFICKTKLTLAFANTIKGDIETSEEILGEIIRTYKTDYMDNEAISRWNLINILNNFIRKKYTGLKEELFQVVTFANNINDNFTKNILKTLLGKMFKDEENAKHALEIYSEQITYFSKEKNAIGALLTWYLIAEANLVVEGPEKSLEVSQKALDVAQSPKINNYFFVVLFNKVIAEAFMAKSEYELAKVNLEKAILVARKFELFDLLSGLYLLYGKYLQDIALVESQAKTEYVEGAAKMYKKAYLIAQGIKNPYLLSKIDKAKTVLNSFCQLNGIVLKDA